MKQPPITSGPNREEDSGVDKEEHESCVPGGQEEAAAWSQHGLNIKTGGCLQTIAVSSSYIVLRFSDVN